MLVRLKVVTFYLLALTFFTVSANSQEVNSFQSQKKNFATSEKWLRLLHYKKTIFGGFKSEADGSGFFLSENGKTDPLSELEANLAAFQTDALFESGHPNLKLTAQCLFPYRYQILKKEFNLNTKDQNCTDFIEWKNKINGKSVTLIFSSYFAGAPASMFGHTFLRIDSERSLVTKRNAILDYAVDFSARTGNENVFFQSFSGLIGLYKGLYSLWPYYIKIKEYNNAEHRDLVEYELQFTKAEVDQLLSHLWELGSTYFDYFFFTENCSYQLLTLIETVKWNWNLSDRFSFHVIPIDTVRAVIEQENALKDVKFRPSISKKLFQRLDALSTVEKSEVSQVIQSKKDPNQITNPIVAESVTHILTMKQIAQTGKLDDLDNQIQFKTLQRRSELEGYDENKLEPIIFKRPDLASLSSRIWFSQGKNVFGYFNEIGIRPALYDLLDNDFGYVPYSSIEFGNLKLRYTYQKSLTLSELNILSTHSINPYQRFGTKLSYFVDFSLKNPKDRSCYGCVVSNVEINAGVAPKFSKMLREETFVPFVMPAIIAQAGSGLENKTRLLMGGRAGIIARFGKYKILTNFREMYAIHQVLHEYQVFDIGHSFSLSKNVSIRNTFEFTKSTQNSNERKLEAQLGISFFY